MAVGRGLLRPPGGAMPQGRGRITVVVPRTLIAPGPGRSPPPSMTGLPVEGTQNVPAIVLSKGLERSRAARTRLPDRAGLPSECAGMRLARAEVSGRVRRGRGAGGEACEGDREPAEEARQLGRALDRGVPGSHPTAARQARALPVGARPAHALGTRRCTVAGQDNSLQNTP